MKNIFLPIFTKYAKVSQLKIIGLNMFDVTHAKKPFSLTNIPIPNNVIEKTPTSNELIEKNEVGPEITEVKKIIEVAVMENMKNGKGYGYHTAHFPFHKSPDSKGFPKHAFEVHQRGYAICKILFEYGLITQKQFVAAILAYFPHDLIQELAGKNNNPFVVEVVGNNEYATFHAFEELLIQHFNPQISIETLRMNKINYLKEITIAGYNYVDDLSSYVYAIIADTTPEVSLNHKYSLNPGTQRDVIEMLGKDELSGLIVNTYDRNLKYYQNFLNQSGRGEEFDNIHRTALSLATKLADLGAGVLGDKELQDPKNQGMIQATRLHFENLLKFNNEKNIRLLRLLSSNLEQLNQNELDVICADFLNHLEVEVIYQNNLLKEINDSLNSLQQEINSSNSSDSGSHPAILEIKDMMFTEGSQVALDRLVEFTKLNNQGKKLEIAKKVQDHFHQAFPGGLESIGISKNS